ncbi:hypothetical protein ACEPPN_008084 [Leptodophora sp. 'Broadleaf-Isolate-01']
MPDHLARLAAKLQPSPESIDQIEDIFLLHPDVPTEQPSSPRFQIGHYDSGGEHHVVPGVSSYAHTEGQLERYFAQDDYVPNAADDQNTNESFLRLRSLRANALRTRSLLRTKRKLLQDKQSAKAAADEAFMRYVREHVSASEFTTLSTKSDTLDQLFNNMQETRDMFGPLQNEYDEIEETLDDMEFEMAMIEGRIHKDTTISSPETPSQDRQKDPIGKASPLAPSSFMDFGSDSTEDYHPLHAQYLSRLGDLDLARERLQDMRQEMQALLSSKETRLNVGLDLHESLQTILAELPEQISASRDEIVEIEKDVERLYSICLAAGIDVDNLGDRNEPSTAEDNEEREANNAAKITNKGGDILDDVLPFPSTDTQNSQSTFPLLLPRTEDEEAKLSSLTPKFDESNKGGQINHWLLDELHTSRLRISLLYRITDEIFLQCNLNLNIQSWQVDVLQFWAKDETSRPTAPIDTYAYSSTVRSHPSVQQRGRPHAKSIGPTSKFLTCPPQLQSRKSAPGLLQYIEALRGNEPPEKIPF